MMTYNTAVVLVGTGILGASAGMIGAFAVLRRRSLMGDALAHAALPGLCLAFLVVGERSLPALLFGALLSGLVGVWCVALLRRYTRVKEDAAIGAVLSVFFGAGVVLSRLIQNQTTTGSKAGLESYIFGKTAGMIAQDVYLIGGVALFCLLLVLLLYKEFMLVAFDTGFAQVQGWPTSLLDVLLTGSIAVVVVIGLPAVGVVLMAALLILPGVSARFWTDRLATMLALATTIGATIGAVGSLLSAQFSLLPTGPIIVLGGTAVFLVSVLFSPLRGILAREWHERRARRTLEQQFFLLALYESDDWGLPHLTHRLGWSESRVHRAIRNAVSKGLLSERASGVSRGRSIDLALEWTATGLERARVITEADKLWELYLQENAEATTDFNDLDLEMSVQQLPPDVVNRLRQSFQNGATP